MSYTSIGSSEAATPSAASSSVRALVWLDGRHGLRHPPEDDPPGLVPLELDRDDAVARLERDHAQLQRRAEDERGAEARVPGERNLVPRREDADADGAAFARRQHEDGLGEPELERQLLHRQLVEVARVGEDGELVARERPVGEDVGEDVAKRTHRSQPTAAPMIGTQMRLFLVRHAHSDPGDPDSLRPLSARGREQARELGERLAGSTPDPVLASPLLRARETAAAIAKAAGVDLRVDERLAPGRNGRGCPRSRRRRGRHGRRRRPPARLLRDRARARRRGPRLRAGGVRRDRAAVSAISVSGLRKSYGGVEAVRGIDFEVEAGEVFGLLGPNGAGKTTTVEILEGYRQRDGGEVSVLGFDPGRSERAFRERIGVVLQQSELWPILTVREVHRIFAGYYKQPRDVDEVIELVGLAEKRDEQVKTLSGGQKRRLDLGVALVGDPELVFLDEPTTGFDPAARRNAWALIRSLRELGKTVLLTTHYLDEAQQLADRVAVLRDGRDRQDRQAVRADRELGRADPLPAARRRGRARDRRADTAPCTS